jgi:hypothetical protein
MLNLSTSRNGENDRLTDAPADLASWRHAVINRLNIITGYSSLLEIGPLTDQQRDAVTEILAAAKAIQKSLERLHETGADGVIVLPSDERADDK